MSCVVFTCENCSHFSHKDFGNLSDPLCPCCESRAVSVEYDEDYREPFYDDAQDSDEDEVEDDD